MIYIEKHQPSKEILEELNKAKKDFTIRSSKEAKIAFDSLTKHAKDLIRESLIKEQHGLCAYCMRRIRSSTPDEITTTTIEHYKPKSEYFDLTLDYTNMLAVCSGGRDKKDKNLCCDASKGDQEITISPFNHDDMNKIRYKTDGTIYTYPRDEILEKDINEILKLNGERNANGDLMNDTSTELVKGRRDTYRNIFISFIKGLQSRNKLTRKNIEKRIQELESAENYQEYVGVLLYFLRRELKKFSK